MAFLKMTVRQKKKKTQYRDKTILCSRASCLLYGSLILKMVPPANNKVKKVEVALKVIKLVFVANGTMTQRDHGVNI